MSIAERYRECARVLDMCEGTSVYPWSCVKYMGKPWIMENRLDLDRQGHYDFAVAILEGKPVFIGDTIYHDKLGETLVDSIPAHMGGYSWNKPKRTFALAGRELPLPSETETQCNAYIGSAPYYFDDPADSYAFEDALNAIISEAIQNARLQNK